MRVKFLVILCFEPNQPPGIIPGLKETFIKRHLAERTSKAEIRPEEQSQRTESCQKNLWNEIQLKGQKKTEIDTRTKYEKRSGQAWSVYYVRHKR